MSPSIKVMMAHFVTAFQEAKDRLDTSCDVRVGLRRVRKSEKRTESAFLIAVSLLTMSYF
jgi:hypothetical protein